MGVYVSQNWMASELMIDSSRIDTRTFPEQELGFAALEIFNCIGRGPSSRRSFGSERNRKVEAQRQCSSGAHAGVGFRYLHYALDIKVLS
jgi:hypothetical protein